MKLLNDDEDMFLHDFSRCADPEVSVKPDEVPNVREFSFDGGTAPKERAVKRGGRGRRFVAWFAFIVVAALATAFYIRYYIPHTTESRTRGYVSLVEKRGIFFKTFEGEMVSDARLTDTARVYSRDIHFSIPSDSLGRLVQSFQATGRPVVITTKKYYGTLPWRGATNTILTDISPQ